MELKNKQKKESYFRRLVCFLLLRKATATMTTVANAPSPMAVFESSLKGPPVGAWVARDRFGSPGLAVGLGVDTKLPCP